jgi:hypothetical protein
VSSPDAYKDLKPASCSGPKEVKEEPNTCIEVEGKEGFEDLWELVRENPKRVMEVVKAHTVLGHTSHIWDNTKRPVCSYKVTIKVGGKTLNSPTEQVGFKFVAPGTVDTFDYNEHANDASKIPKKNKLIVYTRKGRGTTLKPLKLNVYVACEVDRTLGLIKKNFGEYIDGLETNRILLSIDGFPQSFVIDRPPERQTRALWGNIFAIVDADRNIVEPGRNRISDRHLYTVREALTEAIKKLDALATLVREQEEYSNAIDINEAIKSAEAGASANPLSYALPGAGQLHIAKVPEQEQEVIGLFCELLGHELIPNCSILSIGSGAFVYDAYLKYTFHYRDIGESARPRKDEGRRKLDLDLQRTKTLPTEFKVTVERLADELHKGKTRKKLEQISLLICWDEGTLPTGYTLEPLDEDERFFPAATHRLQHTAAKAKSEVVVLRAWLDELEAAATAPPS